MRSASVLLALAGGLTALVLLGLGETPPHPRETPAGEDPLRWTEDVTRLAARASTVERPVVFLGSSSIRRWDSLPEDMAPLPVLNRGFGGSRIHDSVHWFDALVVPEDPRALVVFAGTNDLSGKEPRSPSWIASRFEALARLAGLSPEGGSRGFQRPLHAVGDNARVCEHHHPPALDPAQ